MRGDLVRSAVSFLNDPQVADATLAKRIEFLESKGLTAEEVEEALRQASTPSAIPNSLQSSVSTSSANTINNSSISYSNGPIIPPPLSLPPPIPERDWKDYFVMATVSAGVAYGLYEVTKRYVLPLILPPTPSSLEADKVALETEFSRTETLLEQLQKDSEEVKEEELKRKEQFATILQETQEAIEGVKGQTQQVETDIKLIKFQVDIIKESLPLALEKHRDQQDKALLDLQEELKSLKQLISNRIKNSISSSAPPPASAVPSFIPKSTTISSSPSSLSTPLTAPASSVPPSFPLPPVPFPKSPSSSSIDQASLSASTSSTTPSTPKAGIPAWQLAASSKSIESEPTST